MPLTAKERKQLVARSHPLRPVATVSAVDLSPNAVAQVRDALRTHELVKVRVQAASPAEADTAAAHLAAQVPCQLVKRIGRVVLFFRSDNTSAADALSRPETDA